MDSRLLEKLACFYCQHSSWQQDADTLICLHCGANFNSTNGIPDFMPRDFPHNIKCNTDSDADDYEALISGVKEYRLRRIDRPLLERVKGDVLEIGCGTCRLAMPVEGRQATYFGLDPLLPYLLFGSNRYKLERLVRGVGEVLPFKSGAFDSLISGFYAYRNVDAEMGLPEARRVLKKDGRFVFDLLNFWLTKLMALKSAILTVRLRDMWSLFKLGTQGSFDFINFPQMHRLARKNGFFIEEIFSSPVMPFFHGLEKYLCDFYFRGRKTVYLGYDVIVVLKAI
jgi:SAM-dependent methyltransferase